jgi:hypothetical protein
LKFKLYIVTYRNPGDLAKNLATLFASDLMQYEYEINIINNHSEFSLPEEFIGRVNVLHNSLRADFSKGHLARNWNQAIINGFRDLKNPDCDILVHCQDDTNFMADWATHTINLHKKYSFVTYGWGDNFCSYTADAVRFMG